MIGIRDLAQHLDISIGTVSRALNGKADVNPETRQRVVEAAAKLGYSPNQSGRSLRRGSTGLIGVLIPSDPHQTLIDMVFVSVLDGLRRCLSEHDLDLAIFLYSNEEDPFGAFKRVVERRVVDALVVSQTRTHDQRIEYLIKHGIPFVAFGRSQSGKDRPWVDMDFESSVDQAIDRFASAGHRRIAVVMARHDFNYNRLIADQLRLSLAAAGLEFCPDYLVQQEKGEDGGYIGMGSLLSLAEPPTAVIAADRMLATGIYKRLAEAYVKVGCDIAVIALNCNTQARFLTPALSYFESDLMFVGAELGRALLTTLGQADLKHGRAAPVQTLVPATFVQGESS